MVPEREMRAERDDVPPARPERTIPLLLWIAIVIVVAVVAMWLWSTATAPQAPPVATAPPAAPPPPRALPAPAQPAASAAVHYPLAAEEPPLPADEVPAALGRLLGTKAAASFLRTDDFPRRFAATVDNLAREHAPSGTWPVLPAPGRFLVEERADGTYIAPGNAARYTPLVLLAGTIDVPAAVRLYRRMYPLLQQAYRDLGFGGRYLNDRVVEVIDVLLATPEAPESPRLLLPPIRGPVPSLQPWVRYQFADPELEALSAGQKILVRVGPVNQGRLKARLMELRRELTAPPAGAK